MRKFESLQIKTESEATGGQGAQPRIVKVEENFKKEVTAFEFSKIESTRNTPGKFGSINGDKIRKGSIPISQRNLVDKSRKGNRFTLNPLVRDPLSVAEEERILEDEKVKAQVAIIADEVRVKAARDGYRDGLAKGHEEAFDKFRKDSKERIIHFEKLVEALENAKKDIFKANERYLVELIYRIARMVLLKDLRADREFLLRLCRDLIERVGARDSIRIRISSEESDTVGMLKEGLERTIGNLKNLSVETSSQISRGGCHIETEWNAIDASVETQLQGIYEALVGEANVQAAKTSAESSEGTSPS